MSNLILKYGPVNGYTVHMSMSHFNIIKILYLNKKQMISKVRRRI